jgi:hypothetical protein
MAEDTLALMTQYISSPFGMKCHTCKYVFKWSVKRGEKVSIDCVKTSSTIYFPLTIIRRVGGYARMFGIDAYVVKILDKETLIYYPASTSTCSDILLQCFNCASSNKQILYRFKMIERRGHDS